MTDDNLIDFQRDAFTHEGKTRTVFRQGSGPAVIVMAEMPGISLMVFDFARRVVRVGCTAVVPHLYGNPGRDPSPAAHGLASAIANVVGQIEQVCISREFVVFATSRASRPRPHCTKCWTSCAVDSSAHTITIPRQPTMLTTVTPAGTLRM
jgi:hypothetical protein